MSTIATLPLVTASLILGLLAERGPFVGACATVVMPASMCEDVVKDGHLEQLAIGVTGNSTAG